MELCVTVRDVVLRGKDDVLVVPRLEEEVVDPFFAFGVEFGPSCAFFGFILLLPLLSRPLVRSGNAAVLAHLGFF